MKLFWDWRDSNLYFSVTRKCFREVGGGRKPDNLKETQRKIERKTPKRFTITLFSEWFNFQITNKGNKEQSQS